MSRSGEAMERALELLTSWAEVPEDDHAEVQVRGPALATFDWVHVPFEDAVKVPTTDRTAVAEARSRFEPLCVPARAEDFQNGAPPVLTPLVKQASLTPLVLREEWVHDDPYCDWTLTVSLDDLLAGVTVTDLAPQYRKLSRSLHAQGIDDTRVWRAVYGGIPLEYAVAMFSEAA